MVSWAGCSLQGVKGGTPWSGNKQLLLRLRNCSSRLVRQLAEELDVLFRGSLHRDPCASTQVLKILSFYVNARED